MMMCRVFRVVLVLALLCCCSCVFAVEEEPQVTQVDAVCAGKDKLGRWQLRGKSLWYDCTDAAAGAGKMICGMGVGNCEPEASQSRTIDGVKDAVITINVSTFTPDILKSWWERNVEPKAVTVAIGAAKPPEGPPGPPEDKISRDTSSTPDSKSPTAGAAATTDPSPEASRAPDSAPSAELQGAAHSTSAASAASESPPDPKPTEGGDHFSHDPPVELQEETAAAPPNQLSQTGEDGGAAGGAEEDTAANTTTETDSSEGNNMAASMPAPLSSAPTTNALEKSVGTDACFHDTHLHALPPLVLAALTYGTLG